MPTWKLSRRTLRHYIRIILSCLLSAAVLVIYFEHAAGSQIWHSKRPQAAEPINGLIWQQAQFWTSLHEILLTNQPQSQKPDHVVPRQPDRAFNPNHNPIRPDVLWLDAADVEALRAAHTSYIADVALHPLPPFLASTHGIVTTASESSLAVLTVSLHMLRKSPSQVPVEIFLASPSAFTEPHCTHVFPALNARCRYFSTVFDLSTTPKLSSYQYKIFAILFASFENLLFLDSDSWPLTSPDPLFDSPPFTQTGLVLWPDFWYASESPYFFDIAGIDAPHLHERPSTESGQMMYSKAVHGPSLLLAAYYNFYGPEYYWLLLSQGSSGQGDKETFWWSARVMNESVWAVKTPVQSIGKHDSSGEYIGSAMLQQDPRREWEREQDRDRRRPAVARTGASPTSAGRGMFVHANFPKFDPYTVFGGEHRSLAQDSNGSLARCWMQADQAVELFGYDVEARLWEAMEETVCVTLSGLWLTPGRPSRSALDAVKKRDQAVCQQVHEYRAAVFGID